MRKHTAALFVRLSIAAACIFAVAPSLFAATMTPTVDTPWSFRASFTGVDTDPYSLGGGNDYKVFTFQYWTVLVNLRGDAVDASGNASGFYEIDLWHTGSVIADPTAPKVIAYLFWTGLQPNTTLIDTSVSSQPRVSVGTDYLSTTVNILFDPLKGTVAYTGTIAGNTDMDGDGVLDVDQPTDKAVQTLINLKDVGVITGKEMGQVIKQTVKPK